MLGNPALSTRVTLKSPSQSIINSATAEAKGETKLALKLLSVLFTRAEIADGICTIGGESSGRKLLDQEKIQGIRGMYMCKVILKNHNVPWLYRVPAGHASIHCLYLYAWVILEHLLFRFPTCLLLYYTYYIEHSNSASVVIDWCKLSQVYTVIADLFIFLFTVHVNYMYPKDPQEEQDRWHRLLHGNLNNKCRNTRNNQKKAEGCWLLIMIDPSFLFELYSLLSLHSVLFCQGTLFVGKSELCC